MTDDLALLIKAAQEAGQIARRHFGAGPKSWDKGNGQGPVSEADLEIDIMLRTRLLAARPDYGWLSEETEDANARLHNARIFVVDPIDGTRAFLEGQTGFSHALAVIEDGAVVAAVVHLPMKDLTYAAALGQGAHLNGVPMSVSTRAQVTGAKVLAARPQLAPELWAGGVPLIDRHFRPSLAWRLALVAEGRFDAMLSLRPTWHWDIAAGALLVAEAGGIVTDAMGQGLRFNTKNPQSAGVIAGASGVQGALVMHRLGT